MYRAFVAGVMLTMVVAGTACRDTRPRPGRETAPPRDTPPPAGPYRSEVDEVPGAAVAILIDTSTSMGKAATGDLRPKAAVAHDALEAMLDATDAVVVRRPEFPIKVGLYAFSGKAATILPLQRYDRATVHEALRRVPPPRGDTAIGAAMQAARPDLYRSGVFRKYMLVVTDGENTRGPRPEVVAQEIYARSEGGVQMYFVAFDTSARRFAFLRNTGGAVLEAGNGADLRRTLEAIYQGRILAEADAPGEREPAGR